MRISYWFPVVPIIGLPLTFFALVYGEIHFIFNKGWWWLFGTAVFQAITYSFTFVYLLTR